MVSTWFLYFIFMLYVPSFRVIKTAEIIYCNVPFALTHYALYHAKKDPGIIAKPIGRELEEAYSLDDDNSDNLSQNSEKQLLNTAEDQLEKSERFGPTHNAFGDDVESG